MSTAYLFFADGLEEVEALTTVDLLRRAGVDAKTVSIMGKKSVTGSHDITIGTDLLFEELKDDADLLVLPGGMPGTNYLREHKELAGLLRKQYESGKWVSAICAAPSVLAGLGFLEKRHATSYPTCLDGLPVGTYEETPVVVDGNVITSRGVGTAIPFALTLIEKLVSPQKAQEISDSIIYNM